MPKYLFRDVATDEIVELDVPFEKILNMDVLQQIHHKGRTYRKHNEQEESVTVASKVGTLAYNRPLESRSAGVHSTQAAEFNEAARKAGITGVYYDPKTGNPSFESRGARRRELSRRGLRDLDGGYGDG